MENTGIVTEVRDGKARIRIDRVSACGGNCVSCKGCPSEAVFVEVEDRIGLHQGEFVLLHMETRRFLYSSLIGYGLLALLVLAGAILGYCVFQVELISVLGAVCGLVIGLIVLKVIFGKRQQSITVRKKEDLS